MLQGQELRNLKDWETIWIDWFKTGCGLDLKGYSYKEIIKVVKDFDLNDFVTEAGCLDCHAVLKACIRMKDIQNGKVKKSKRIKGTSNINHRQCTNKDFLIVTSRK